MSWTFDPLIDNGLVPFGSSGSTSGTIVIPELTSDPFSPAVNEAWVLVTTTSAGTGGGNAGQPIGLLLALTYSGGVPTYSYQFSYYTTENTTVRVAMS